MPGKRKDDSGLEDLVENPALFHQDLNAFFRSGAPKRLQRWFIAMGDRRKSELLAAHMVEWFRDKLAVLIPEDKDDPS